jgi:hypothetical protein
MIESLRGAKALNSEDDTLPAGAQKRELGEAPQEILFDFFGIFFDVPLISE